MPIRWDPPWCSRWPRSRAYRWSHSVSSGTWVDSNRVPSTHWHSWLGSGCPLNWISSQGRGWDKDYPTNLSRRGRGTHIPTLPRYFYPRHSSYNHPCGEDLSCPSICRHFSSRHFPWSSFCGKDLNCCHWLSWDRHWPSASSYRRGWKTRVPSTP